jgi:branched-subunit amino acid ABC-type transport system permease component
MNALSRLAAIAALLCALAGCAGVDTNQARICRSIVPALNLSAAAIEVVRTAPLASVDGVRVDYRVHAEVGSTHSRFVECRFAPSGPAMPLPASLVSVRTEAGPLSDLRLQLIRRFWLEREGAAADPEPVANSSSVPTVPRVLAVGLQHLVSALPPIAIYALLAVAYSLIYGLVGRINLAFGELAAFGGYAAFLAFALVGSQAGTWGSIALPLALALTFALTAALSHGIASAWLVFQPLTRLSGQQVLIGTIALAIVLQEYLRLAQGSTLRWVRPLLNEPFAVARSGDFVVTMTPAAMTAAALCLSAALALLLLMRASRFGRAWRACADDAGAAALFGVDRGMVLMKTFALASALAGLAGYVVTVYYGTFGYAAGIVLGLKSLLAAIAGGIGSVPGAFLGGILLGGVETLWSALFPIEVRDLAVFILFALLMVLRPSGLFGLGELPPPRM